MEASAHQCLFQLTDIFSLRTMNWAMIQESSTGATAPAEQLKMRRVRGSSEPQRRTPSGPAGTDLGKKTAVRLGPLWLSNKKRTNKKLRYEETAHLTQGPTVPPPFFYFASEAHASVERCFFFSINHHCFSVIEYRH